MMLSVFNFLRGYVRITVRGFFPERFLNICARRGILLWDVVRKEKTTMYANISIKGFKKLRTIAKKSRCTVRIEKKYGMPFLVFRYRKRKALIAGVLLFFCLLFIMTQFIWVIDIEGNETVSDAEIIENLEKNGLHTGIIKYLVDEKNINYALMREIPSLSYIAVNVKGTTAGVTVREREKLPEKYMRNEPTDIVASRGGVIEKIHTQSGMQLVRKGDVVVEGEVLVSGIVTASDKEFMRYENSDAEIIARTWHESEVKPPYFKEEKMPTGREKTKLSLKFFNFDIKFFIKDGISYPTYDIIESGGSLKLSESVVLPFGYNKKVYKETETVMTELTEEEMLEHHKEKFKNEHKEAEIVSQKVERIDGKIRITYECIENIAVEKNTLWEETDDNGEKS